MLTLAALYTPPRANVGGYFVEEDDVNTVPLNGSSCRQQEDRVGMLSESSHIATGPLKQK